MLDRRGFLRLVAAGSAATAASACGGGGSRDIPPTQASTRRTPPPAAHPGRLDWRALGRGLQGPLVRPGRGDYETARLLFNERFDSVHPAAVAFCETPDDVKECIAFVRRYRAPLALRAGGHCYAGWSTGPGLVVDVSRMGSVHVDAGRAVIGAGARLVDVYAALAEHGVSIPAGSCPTVGVAGLALGGGVGVVSRMHGLTCDAVEAIEVVTADGRLLRCDAHHHADLYWASRGGGGGNFGVATSFTFRTHPTRSVALAFLRWDWRHAAAVIQAWQEWAPHAPDALFSNAHLLSVPGGAAPKASVGAVLLGDQGELERLLDGLVGKVGAAPVSRVAESTSYPHAMMVEAGCSDEALAQCHLPWQARGGQLSRVAYAAKSDLVTRPLSTAGVDVVVREVERRQRMHGLAEGGIAFDALGGVVGRVTPDATAFVHRNALYLAQYTATWGGDDPASVVERNLDWLRAFHKAMRPHVSGGAYQNYVDPDLADWKSAYYGANYGRLVRVKAAYDPDRVFRVPQGIPPA